MPSRRTSKIAETEWNFRPVPENQEHSCLVWELARESKTMRSKIKARKQRGGSYVLNTATNVKFTAESFCLHFKYFLDYFPQTPWRDIPENLESSDASELGLNVLLSTFGERQAFTVMHERKDVPAGTGPLRTHDEFVALAKPHLVPFRALVNLSYKNSAIEAEFAKWLAGVREQSGIEEMVEKPGVKMKVAGRPKADSRTSINRLAINYRLGRLATFDFAN